MRATTRRLGRDFAVKNEPATIRVLLVDDHAVVREGYRRLLEATGSITVVGEAANADQAYRLQGELAPDVVVMDITLPGASGLEAMRRILVRDPDARVLVFSMHEDVVFPSRAMTAGARGYLTKSSAPDVLVEGVRAVARGRKFLSPDVAQAMGLHSLQAGETGLSALSEREFEIFRLLVVGRNLNEISNLLNLNYKTVANYQSSLRRKLGAATQMQIMRIAQVHGLLETSGGKGDSTPE